jgi:hypothetical protein
MNKFNFQHFHLNITENQWQAVQKLLDTGGKLSVFSNLVVQDSAGRLVEIDPDGDCTRFLIGSDGLVNKERFRYE